MDFQKVGAVIPLKRSALAERSDDELMQIASAGVDQAFAELVRRYQEQVRGYCTRCCGPAAGDDVAQEVFLEIWRTRERYEPRGRFRSFLFTVMHNRALNSVRRRRDEVELTDDIHFSGRELDAVLEAGRARRVCLKLGRLPRKLQEALLLRFAAGLGYAEMSEVLEDMARSDRRWRNIMYGVFGVLGLADLASVSVQLAVPTFRKKLKPSTVAAGVGSGVLFIALGLAARVMDLPTERLLRLYRADPGLQVGFDVAPVDGGATVGLSGRY